MALLEAFRSLQTLGGTVYSIFFPAAEPRPEGAFSMSVILGLNAFHAGAAAAVLIDGQVVAAIPEERLNRVKYYARFPALSIQKCLQMAGVAFKDIDYVAVG